MQKQFYSKKIILLPVVLLLLHFAANAQRFRAGITAGLVATDVHGADIYDYDTDFHKAGFVGGASVTMPLSKKATLGLELNYIQKGTQQPADTNGYGFYKFSFNYLEFPLIFKYRIHFNVSKKPVNGFDLHGGASVGRLISNLEEGDYFYSTDDSYLNKTDVSLLIGFDYNFSEHFNFCFRYSNSVIPVIKRNSTVPGSPLTTYNNGNNMVLHFMLQCTFGSAKGSEEPAMENNSQ